ncbi:hypothetical protein [Streptococcus sanguinis]|uniref:hypothetical protein n=1 Tax=Streptococcus sanguinis TaxID=1305 RepID=UPI001CBE8470|nr:hypothetical protein [Streptococcus sanguinis]MBZ2021410.1 hypothetical protein [Streptococcus sanguinis]MBZ2073745.1 hypothetical protein [Streptococcus sanguinis]MBZ2081668.1 hypothetical protein [Streptococcus sanguinis]MCC3165746.1 hypothetical protein [Streptococcus sanguinis]
MIANIRIRSDGSSSELCQLDLMKFSIEGVRRRMEERGIQEEDFFVSGFSDWGVDTNMSLQEAYILKNMIANRYEGDDYLVQYLFKAHKSFIFVMAHNFKFVSKDEVELMQYLLKEADMDKVVTFFYQASNWPTAVQSYISKGIVLNTPRGFYVEEV